MSLLQAGAGSCWPDRRCLCWETFGLNRNKLNISLLIVGRGFNIFVVALFAIVLTTDEIVKCGDEVSLLEKR